MLLDFSVVNYRCFADEAVLDLTRSSLKTLTPRPGSSWEDETWRVAALYGANASGKSTLLDAVECLCDAVGGHRGLLHQPYLLDTKHTTAPTSYTIGFTHADQRFRYSVKAHSWGVAREELWTAGPRWRRLFARTQGPEDDTPVIDAGPTLRGATAEVRRITTVEDLFLAVALRYRHETLAPVARSLRAMHSIHHSDMERERWLRWIMRHLDNRPTQWSELSNAIAHAADLGITRVELEELELAPQLLENLRRLMGKDDKGETRIPEEMLRDFQRSLVFAHTGADGQEHRLDISDQSQGTLTWFTTIGPAIEALRLGQVLLVDELDASLHPALTAEIVEMFKDTDLNRSGAQIVFTTHDTSLMDNSPTQLLERDEIWMCEKHADGSSELFSLADFTSTRKGTNKQRRYLVGAFGAVPRVDTSGIRRILTEGLEED